jgi:hypothetical protein
LTRIKPTNCPVKSTGFGSHGDYVFGWKGDALQRAMDSSCYVNCPTLKTQSISEMNKCSLGATVNEKVDGCKLPLTFLFLVSPGFVPFIKVANSV